VIFSRSHPEPTNCFDALSGPGSLRGRGGRTAEKSKARSSLITDTARVEVMRLVITGMLNNRLAESWAGGENSENVTVADDAELGITSVAEPLG